MLQHEKVPNNLKKGRKRDKKGKELLEEKMVEEAKSVKKEKTSSEIH